MTKREKVIIDSLERCTCYVPDTCRNCAYNDKLALDCWPILRRDALELLKEREHIKPTVAVDTWICSNCGHTLESQTLIDDGENLQVLVNEQYDFCPQCGKEVRWE